MLIVLLIILLRGYKTLFYFEILISVDNCAELWYTIQVGTRGADESYRGMEQLGSSSGS